MGRIRYTTLARLDLSEAIDFYEHEDVGVSFRFYEDVKATVARVAAHPDIGEHYWGSIRRSQCHAFPYYIYYQQAWQGGIRVVAVGHQSRNPKRWKPRLE